MRPFSPLRPWPRLWRSVAQAGLGLALTASALGAAPAPASCQARSGDRQALLIELYTSEGCNSCPPADRWLSSLSRRDDVLALSFHVTYWDRLGWTDRFAQAAFTDRQRALMVPSGARYVYTPQVVVNGRDAPRWELPKAAAAAPLDLQLTRDGSQVTALITPRAGSAAAARQWTGYWAVLEDGHRSDVRAGENAGEKLRHDHVVRYYQPVAAWPADHDQRLQWQMPRTPELAAGVQRRVAFVVVNPDTQRPVQALALGC